MAKKRLSRKKPSSKTTGKATAKKKRKPRSTKPAAPANGLDGDISTSESGHYTGRMIATVMDTDRKAIKDVLKTISNATGLSSSTSNVAFSGSDGKDTTLPDDVNYQVLEHLGIVVLNDTNVDQTATASVNPQDHNVVMEREMWNYALGSEATIDLDTDPDHSGLSSLVNANVSTDYLLGMRDAINLILQQRGSVNSALSETTSQFEHDTDLTWGVRAIGAADSTLSGSGVRVAILDSGFDTNHPDFAGRSITQASFIPRSEPDNDVLDRNGHGTHCIGIACGPQSPGVGPRYGIAYNAEIYSGKVLRQIPGGKATGRDGWTLAGIDWAMRNHCQIISLSLGTPVTSLSHPVSYERAAQRGLTKGCLMIAASGNDSQRARNAVKPVGRPANCPSILAVAAIDKRMSIADFSNGMKFGNGGEVNLAGPGVGILSSVPMPKRHAVFNGTSMATPHVAGIAALVCEQTGLTGLSLYHEMRKHAQSLGRKSDFGHGLVRITDQTGVSG